MINQENWEEWLESPETEVLLKYLRDSVKEEVEMLSDSIRGGAILSEGEQIHVVTKIEVLERISEISIEEIEDFYQKEEE